MEPKVLLLAVLLGRYEFQLRALEGGKRETSSMVNFKHDLVPRCRSGLTPKSRTKARLTQCPLDGHPLFPQLLNCDNLAQFLREF